MSSPPPSHPVVNEGMGVHYKVLGWLYLVFGVLGALGGVVLFGILSFLGLGMQNIAMRHMPWGPFTLASGLGVLIGLILLLLSIPGIIAGYGLLNFRGWARPLTIVLSAINLIHPPFGTLLGAYGLWVVLSSRGELYFRDKLASLQP